MGLGAKAFFLSFPDFPLTCSAKTAWMTSSHSRDQKQTVEGYPPFVVASYFFLMYLLGLQHCVSLDLCLRLPWRACRVSGGLSGDMGRGFGTGRFTLFRFQIWRVWLPNGGGRLDGFGGFCPRWIFLVYWSAPFLTTLFFYAFMMITRKSPRKKKREQEARTEYKGSF